MATRLHAVPARSGQEVPVPMQAYDGHLRPRGHSYHVYMPREHRRQEAPPVPELAPLPDVVAPDTQPIHGGPITQYTRTAANLGPLVVPPDVTEDVMYTRDKRPLPQISRPWNDVTITQYPRYRYPTRGVFTNPVMALFEDAHSQHHVLTEDRYEYIGKGRADLFPQNPVRADNAAGFVSGEQTKFSSFLYTPTEQGVNTYNSLA